MNIRHILSSVDAESRTANCSVCGPVKITSQGIRSNKSGDKKRWGCSTRINESRGERRKVRDHWTYNKNRQYLCYRLTYCENCGFVALDLCQLDVDHIDGDHHNNNPDNLQTLCANCHRLKTHRPDLFEGGTMPHVIHPNENGPTHASSPYKRKLEEVRRAVQGLLAVAQVEDAVALMTIRESLDELIGRA